MISSAWQNPLPESLVLLVPEWHHTMGILSFHRLNKNFILLVLELVVDVVGAKHRNFHKKNKLRLKRKIILDEIEFPWKVQVNPISSVINFRSSRFLPFL
jgi:hypothetical protein